MQFRSLWSFAYDRGSFKKRRMEKGCRGRMGVKRGVQGGCLPSTAWGWILWGTWGCRKRSVVIVGKSSDDNDLDNNDDDEEERMLVSRDIFLVAGVWCSARYFCHTTLIITMIASILPTSYFLPLMIIYEFIDGFPKLKNTQGTCHTWGTKPTPRLSSFLPENLVGNSKYLRYAKERWNISFTFSHY